MFSHPDTLSCVFMVLICRSQSPGMPGYMYSYIKQGRSVSSLRFRSLIHIVEIINLIFNPITVIVIRRPIEPYDRKTSHPPMHFHLPSDKSRKVSFSCHLST